MRLINSVTGQSPNVGTPMSARKLMGNKIDDIVSTSVALTRVIVEVDGDVLTVKKGLLAHTTRKVTDPCTVLAQLKAIVAAFEAEIGSSMEAAVPQGKKKTLLAARDVLPEEEDSGSESEQEDDHEEQTAPVEGEKELFPEATQLAASTPKRALPSTPIRRPAAKVDSTPHLPTPSPAALRCAMKTPQTPLDASVLRAPPNTPCSPAVAATPQIPTVPPNTPMSESRTPAAPPNTPYTTSRLGRDATPQSQAAAPPTPTAARRTLTANEAMALLTPTPIKTLIAATQQLRNSCTDLPAVTPPPRSCSPVRPAKVPQDQSGDPMPELETAIEALTEAVGTLTVKTRGAHKKKDAIPAPKKSITVVESQTESELFDKESSSDEINRAASEDEDEPDSDSDADSCTTSTSEDDDEDNSSTESSDSDESLRRVKCKMANLKTARPAKARNEEKPRAVALQPIPIPQNPTKCTVVQLRELLRSRGLPVTGTKAILLDRLVCAMPAPADD